MIVQIVAPRRALTGRAARRIIGRCALVAIGAGLGAISISTHGADPPTGSSPSIANQSHVTRADHRSVTALPSAPTDTKLDYLAAHSRMVDQLNEELMRWTLPCAPASTNASMAGRC
jgi:hypothetical protein